MLVTQQTIVTALFLRYFTIKVFSSRDDRYGRSQLAAMGTRGLEIVRFRKRYWYYIRYHKYDSYYDSLGKHIVASIPADPDEYRKWLESMRNHYASTEHELEDQIYEIRNGPEPDEQDHGFDELPTELPKRLDD
ncbi:hypothetical protein PCL_09518 [Purpureocillium lilacinum]|uniref:Uncharacterized protein n=1 Tax=Purpureocillium lilacinum TaxID=33203 RepID=A0A2U3DQQ7_PURLI|nr:hypothetical protein PCL_09518 [Purpureocillium lilacinum]